MKTIEASNTLSQLVDQVRSGEEIVLTRHGKPVARLTPVVDAKQSSSMDWLAQSCAQRFAAKATN